eukprot:scaffold425_cov373-Pinguiococcus_pyrenoidosus.AAC.7
MRPRRLKNSKSLSFAQLKKGAAWISRSSADGPCSIMAARCRSLSAAFCRGLRGKQVRGFSPSEGRIKPHLRGGEAILGPLPVPSLLVIPFPDLRKACSSAKRSPKALKASSKAFSASSSAVDRSTPGRKRPRRLCPAGLGARRTPWLTWQPSSNASTNPRMVGVVLRAIRWWFSAQEEG